MSMFKTSTRQARQPKWQPSNPCSSLWVLCWYVLGAGVLGALGAHPFWTSLTDPIIIASSGDFLLGLLCRICWATCSSNLLSSIFPPQLTVSQLSHRFPIAGLWGPGNDWKAGSTEDGKGRPADLQQFQNVFLDHFARVKIRDSCGYLEWRKCGGWSVDTNETPPKSQSSVLCQLLSNLVYASSEGTSTSLCAWWFSWPPGIIWPLISSDSAAERSAGRAFRVAASSWPSEVSMRDVMEAKVWDMWAGEVKWPQTPVVDTHKWPGLFEDSTETLWWKARAFVFVQLEVGSSEVAPGEI